MGSQGCGENHPRGLCQFRTPARVRVASGVTGDARAIGASERCNGHVCGGISVEPPNQGRGEAGRVGREVGSFLSIEAHHSAEEWFGRCRGKTDIVDN